jgi:integrase
MIVTSSERRTRLAAASPAPHLSDVGLMRAWLEGVRETGTENTFITYQRILEQLVRDALARHVSVTELCADDLDAFTRIDSEKGEPRVRQTRTLYLAVVKAFYGWLVGEGHVAESAADLVVPAPWAGTPPADGLDDEEAEALEASSFHWSSSPARDRAAVLVSLHAGLKRGEALSLTWDDIVDGAMLVPGTHARVVPLSDTLATCLERLRRQQRPRQLLFTRGGTELPVTGVGYGQWLNAAGEQCGIPQLTAEKLRSTFRRRLFERGVPAEGVAELCGYSSKGVAKRALQVMRVELTPCRCGREYDVRPVGRRCPNCLGVGAMVDAPQGYLDHGSDANMAMRLRCLATALSNVPVRLLLAEREDRIDATIARMVAHLEVAAAAVLACDPRRERPSGIAGDLTDLQFAKALRSDGSEARKLSKVLLDRKTIGMARATAMDRAGANAAFIAWAIQTRRPIPELWPIGP